MQHHYTPFIAAIAVAIAVSPFTSAHELLIGRVDNQLAMHFQDEAFELPESEIPGFPGFADVNPGFVALPSDLPDLSTLPAGADLEWTLLSIDPGILVLNDTGTGYLNVGETYNIGMPVFHVHPLWHNPAGVPGEVYSLSLRLHDRAGLLTDSEAYTIEFTPIPEPAGAALLLLGAGIIARRR